MASKKDKQTIQKTLNVIKEGASKGYIPDDDVRNLFSLINSNTDQPREIRLTFSGKDNYFKASKIEFIDAWEKRTIDLPGQPKGTEFWLAFPENAYYRSSYLPNKINAELKITAETTSEVWLNFSENTSLNVSFTVNAGSHHVYRLTQEQIKATYCELTSTGPAGGFGFQILKKGLQVVSDQSVSLCAMIQTVLSTDVTDVLPTDKWGDTYYSINYQPYPSRIKTGIQYDPKSGYMIIARENDTIIYENGIFKANINKGQVFCGYSFLGDMTGKYITTNKPAAFFTTTSMAQIPTGTKFNDVLFQQLPPVNQWGRHFVVPLIPGLSENRIRVLAAKNQTNITVTGITELPVTGTGGNASLSGLNAGEFVELKLTNACGCYIVADKPVGTCAFLTGSDVNSDIGDPAQTWIPPLEQMDRNVLMSPFVPKDEVTRLKRHGILIIVPTAAKEQTDINSRLLPNAPPFNWIDVPGCDYSFLSLLEPGKNQSHSIDNPGGVIVLGYGIGDGTGNEESYYYVGKYGANDLSSDFSVNEENYLNYGKKLYDNSSVFI